jgi:extradiol dioxygenase
LNLRRLGYVGVESPQFRVWEEIGPDVFAMQLGVPAKDGAVRLKIDDYDYRISVHPGEVDRLAYLGWELTRIEDLEAAIAQLSDVGVAVSVASAEECAERRVSAMISFTNPAGLRFELYVGLYSCDRSFVSPRQHGGFKTGDGGLGHVGLSVPDPVAEDEFLRKVLGFRPTDTTYVPGMTVRFYHLNSRHHTLATLPSPGLRGLQHIMVEVNEIDDVGIALDRIKSRKDMPFTLQLGRHSTDRMLSFYAATPCGFEIEYGWGGRTIDETWTPTATSFPSEIWGHQFETISRGAVEKVEDPAGA